MPNWCSNTLELTHKDPAMVDKARDAWNSGKFLGTLVPEPDYKTTPVALTFPEISAQHAKTEEARQAAVINAPTIREDSWWDWRVQNWGTKWDIGLEDGETPVEVEGNMIRLCFQSAWSPPTEAYSKLEDMGYELIAYYFEPGMDFCGKYADGVDDCYVASEDGIPSDVDQEMGVSETMEAFKE